MLFQNNTVSISKEDKMKLKKATALAVTAAMVLGLAGCGTSSSSSTGSSAASSAGEEETAAEAVTEAASEVETEAAEESTEAVTEAVEEASTEEADDAAAGAAEETAAITGSDEEAEIQVFIAASLSTVMDEITEHFNELYPNVKVTFNADSSGKLLTQIEEGYACDVFFSAAQKQMNTLEEDDGLVIEGTRHNVVNNQLCVITLKDSGTKVTGLETLGDASSIALADGSVPVGRYTRVALMNLGILPETDDPSVYTTAEVSEALGGVEISEQSNVSKVLAAVVEASCEVGTTYYSDTYGYEDDIEILEKVPYDLTGNVIYPIAQVQNDEADETEVQAAADFVNYVISDDAKAIFQAYYFDTDVE